MAWVLFQRVSVPFRHLVQATSLIHQMNQFVLSWGRRRTAWQRRSPAGGLMASPSTEDALPLVFVDGVSNRQGPKYDAGVKARDALFRRFLLGSHRRSSGTEARPMAAGTFPRVTRPTGPRWTRTTTASHASPAGRGEPHTIYPTPARDRAPTGRTGRSNACLLRRAGSVGGRDLDRARRGSPARNFSRFPGRFVGPAMVTIRGW
jgi:hypothetical protein